MAQHAILRFEKHKGNPARPLEAHHERQKDQYASNPDIDTSRSKYNFHIVKPEGRYYHFIQSRIEQAGCRTRKDSTRFVDTLITASLAVGTRFDVSRREGETCLKELRGDLRQNRYPTGYLRYHGCFRCCPYRHE